VCVNNLFNGSSQQQLTVMPLSCE
ncbi:unnamed protein product, partial [Rotaria socialis]